MNSSRMPSTRFPAILMGALLLMVSLSVNAASITVELSRSGSEVGSLEVNMECDGRLVQNDVIKLDRSLVMDFSAHESLPQRCVVKALPVAGRTLDYRSDGGSISEVFEEGCEFSGFKPGDLNFCLVRVEDELTEVRVYIRWIGSGGDEPPIEARLVCRGISQLPPLWVQADRMGSWRLTEVPEEGLRCSVSETREEEFIADMSDCRNLLVLPGTVEDCTLVNTKVVKRIEMLNRYGKVIMVSVFLMVGLLAARRFA